MTCLLAHRPLLPQHCNKNLFVLAGAPVPLRLSTCQQELAKLTPESQISLPGLQILTHRVLKGGSVAPKGFNPLAPVLAFFGLL